MTAPALYVSNLRAGYGASEVLRGISFEVSPNSCVALLARNGVGKTTLATAIAGWINLRADALELGGASLLGLEPYEIARAGLGYVPQGRRPFRSLTVGENLSVVRMGVHKESLALVSDLFPVLRDRWNQMAGTLSGGQQQMLAIARALMGQPSLLLLDEPTEGLAPTIIEELLSGLLALKETGVSMLLLEQRLDFALSLADTVEVMGTGGGLAFSGNPGELADRHDIQHRYLGIAEEEDIPDTTV